MNSLAYEIVHKNQAGNDAGYYGPSANVIAKAKNIPLSYHNPKKTKVSNKHLRVLRFFVISSLFKKAKIFLSLKTIPYVGEQRNQNVFRRRLSHKTIYHS